MGGVVAEISNWLEMPPRRNRRPIRRTLERYMSGKPLARHGGGAPPKLQGGAALVAADCISTLRLSENQSAYFVSNVLAERGFDNPNVTGVQKALPCGPRGCCSCWCGVRAANQPWVKSATVVPGWSKYVVCAYTSMYSTIHTQGCA